MAMEEGIMGESRHVCLAKKQEEEIRREYLDLTAALATVDPVEIRGGDSKIDEAAAAGAGLPKMVIKDGKRMELVSQEFIDSVLSAPPLPPVEPVDHARIDTFGARAERYRALAVSLFKARQEVRDVIKDILDQYHSKGYAYSPIDDDEFIEDLLR